MGRESIPLSHCLLFVPCFHHSPSPLGSHMGSVWPLHLLRLVLLWTSLDPHTPCSHRGPLPVSALNKQKPAQSGSVVQGEPTVCWRTQCNGGALPCRAAWMESQAVAGKIQTHLGGAPRSVMSPYNMVKSSVKEMALYTRCQH